MIYLQLKEQFNQFAKLNIETGEAQYENKGNLVEGKKFHFQELFLKLIMKQCSFFATKANCS